MLVEFQCCDVILTSKVSIYIRDIYELKGILIDTESKYQSYDYKIENLSGLIENLRDSNLDLEVENFISNQDLAILEARLLKYQQHFKYNEDCAEFKAELMRLLQENKQQIYANAGLQDQLISLTGEFHQMQQIANEAKELQMILQKSNKEMQNQVSICEGELDSVCAIEETPSGEYYCNFERTIGHQVVPATHSALVSPQDLDVYGVSPLQDACGNPNMLCKCTSDMYDNIGPQEIENLKVSFHQKELKLDQSEDLLYNTQEKLDVSLTQYDELRNELQQLICQIRSYENQDGNNVNDSTVCCQKEIDLCKENLCDLKCKFENVKELLNERTEQFYELEAKYQNQSQACACLKRQLQDNRLQYEGDVTELKQTIGLMNNKLKKAEITCDCLQKECKRNHELLVETSMRESQLQKQLATSQHQHAELKNESQNQEQLFCNCIDQLESKSNGILKDTDAKDRQLDLATAHINELKSAAKLQLSMAHDEINRTRNDIQTVLLECSNLKVQNENLKGCICQAQAVGVKFEKVVQVSTEKLQQCICELEAMKTERNYLASINKKLNKELKELRISYSNMNRDYQTVSESVLCLENELVTRKINHNELCLESRNIIDNIRAWLDDQAVIKSRCEQKIKSDQLQICKLQHKISLLEEFNDKCSCNARRQCGGTSSATRIPGHPWSHGSQGTSSGPDSEFSNQEWSTYEDGGEESCVEEFSNLWLHQIGNMTQLLKKSNRYWKSKATDDYMVTKDQ